MARRSLLGRYDDEQRVASRTRNTSGAFASRTRNPRPAPKATTKTPQPTEYYSKDKEGFITVPKVNISKGNRKQIRAISDAYFAEQGFKNLDDYMKRTFGRKLDGKSDRQRYEMAYESILKGTKVYNEEIQKSVDERKGELKAELERKAGSAELEAGRMGKNLLGPTQGRQTTTLGKMGGVRGILGRVMNAGGQAMQRSESDDAKKLGGSLSKWAKRLGRGRTSTRTIPKRVGLGGKGPKPEAKPPALREGRQYGRATLLGTDSRDRRAEALRKPGASRENRTYTPFGLQPKVQRSLLGAK